MNIFSEYIDLMEDAEAKYLMRMQSDLSILGEQIIEVDTAFHLLAITYDERLIEHLKEFDIVLDLSEDEFLNDHQAYIEALAKASDQIANLRHQFSTLEKDYNSAINSKEGGPIMDDMFFTKMLRRLATYTHTPVIRAEDLYTDEYVLLYKDFVEWVEANSKHIEKEEPE